MSSKEAMMNKIHNWLVENVKHKSEDDEIEYADYFYSKNICKVISDMLHTNEDIENRGMSQPGLNLFAKLIGHRMNINAESFSKNCILKTNFYSNLPEVSC
jgi:hypothetical protein